VTVVKPIPIEAARRIAKEYGYDQIVVIARKVGSDPDPHGESCTTYGVNKAHCDVAAKLGYLLKTKVMGWRDEEDRRFGQPHYGHGDSE
jgi:hypothetical protein